jgi:HSP20 family protein
MNITRRSNVPGSYRASPVEDHIGRIFENMFEDMLAPYGQLARLDQDAVTSPRINVAESDKAFEIEAELPGANKEDIKVAIEGRRVTLEAEEKREDRKEGENLIYVERTAKKFSRAFTLPADVDDNAARARFENGILRLTLPKRDAAAAKKLTVQ